MKREETLARKTKCCLTQRHICALCQASPLLLSQAAGRQPRLCVGSYSFVATSMQVHSCCVRVFMQISLCLRNLCLHKKHLKWVHTFQTSEVWKCSAEYKCSVKFPYLILLQVTKDGIVNVLLHTLFFLGYLFQTLKNLPLLTRGRMPYSWTRENPPLAAQQSPTFLLTNVDWWCLFCMELSLAGHRCQIAESTLVRKQPSFILAFGLVTWRIIMN